MKNADDAGYLQIDNQKPVIARKKGVEILTSRAAFDKYSFVKQWLKHRPDRGYFIWVKENTAELKSCMMIRTKNQRQRLKNLIVLEPGVKTEAVGICETEKAGLAGKHEGESLVVLKKGSSLKLKHEHQWSESDEVKMNLKIVVETGASLEKIYECFKPPKSLKIASEIKLKKEAKANLKTVILADKSRVSLNEKNKLLGDGAEAVIRLRLVGKEESQIRAKTVMRGKGNSAGHVDCMGLVIGDQAMIKVIPGLINADKLTSLTHEASVGRIEKEKLDYLRTRGLSEQQAIDLIVSGFLKINDKIFF